MIMFGVLIRFPSSSGDGLRRAFSRRQARSEVAGVTCGKRMSCSLVVSRKTSDLSLHAGPRADLGSRGRATLATRS